MMNKLFLLQRTGRLTCRWVLTGDPRIPLACVWAGSKTPQSASTLPSTENTEGMNLCA